MTNINEKVSRGQNWGPPTADTHNTLIDVAIAHKQRAANQQDIGNTEGAVINRHCLELDAVLINTANPVAPYSPATLLGVGPSGAYVFPTSPATAVQESRILFRIDDTPLVPGKWGVVRRGLDGNNRVGKILLEGFTWLKVYIVSNSHKYCDASADQSRIESMPFGHAKILYKPDSNTGEKWCLVHVGETEIERLYSGTAQGTIVSTGSVDSDPSPDGEGQVVTVQHISNTEIANGDKVYYVKRIDGQRWVVTWETAPAGGGGSTNVCQQMQTYPAWNVDVAQILWHGAGGSCDWVTFCDVVKTSLNWTVSPGDPNPKDQYIVIHPDGTCHLEEFNLCQKVKETNGYNDEASSRQILVIEPPVYTPGVGYSDPECRVTTICEAISDVPSHDDTKKQFLGHAAATNAPCEWFEFNICEELQAFTGRDDSKEQFVGHAAGSNICRWISFDTCERLRAFGGRIDANKQVIGHLANSNTCQWIDLDASATVDCNALKAIFNPPNTGTYAIGFVNGNCQLIQIHSC